MIGGTIFSFTVPLWIHYLFIYYFMVTLVNAIRKVRSVYVNSKTYMYLHDVSLSFQKKLAPRECAFVLS